MSAFSWEVLRVMQVGEAVQAAGVAITVDGYTMLPIVGGGAVEIDSLTGSDGKPVPMKKLRVMKKRGGKPKTMLSFMVDEMPLRMSLLPVATASGLCCLRLAELECGEIGAMKADMRKKQEEDEPSRFDFQGSEEEKKVGMI